MNNNPSEEEVEQLKQCLPRVPSLINPNRQHINYQGSWLSEENLHKILKFQRNFNARDTDIIITGFPKTGTTWLKSLLFTLVTRVNYPILNRSPLFKNHPHELVYNLESDIYGDAFEYPKPQHLDELPSPRLFSTHFPYTSLPESIRESKCRLIYTCRNPLDTMVSYFHFISSYFMKLNLGNDHFQPPRFEDLFEEFCQGINRNGPFFEHVVAYWKMSVQQPDKVLFLKYEDLKDDPVFHLKRVANFIGMSFSPEEESKGVINQIIEVCSIGNMKELEVNKSGVINKFFEKKSYFRKGEVGGWKNYFTPTMVEKITKIMNEKLEGTGLSFNLNP